MKRENQELPECKAREIELELVKSAKDNVLTCQQAHQLAADLDVEPIIIGRTANALKIKISDCQLGCFGRYKER